MSKQLGHIGKLRIKISEPMAMDFDMEYQSIALLVGTNGSGKSLLLKINWAVSTIMSTLINGKKMGVQLDPKETAQYVMDGTFSNQNFHGDITAYFENGTLELSIDEGKVTMAGYDAGGVEGVPTPIFMSTQTRTFDQIDMYLQLEKKLTKEELLENYRLYDMVFIERMKMFFEKGMKATSIFKETMKNYDMGRYDFDMFTIEDCVTYFANSKGEKRRLSTLSRGEQSLVNMHLATTGMP